MKEVIRKLRPRTQISERGRLGAQMPRAPGTWGTQEPWPAGAESDPRIPWNSARVWLEFRKEPRSPETEIPTCSRTAQWEEVRGHRSRCGPGLRGTSAGPHLEGDVKLVAHPPELAAISLCSPEVGRRRTRAAPEGAEILLLCPFIIL